MLVKSAYLLASLNGRALRIQEDMQTVTLLVGSYMKDEIKHRLSMTIHLKKKAREKKG